MNRHQRRRAAKLGLPVPQAQPEADPLYAYVEETRDIEPQVWVDEYAEITQRAMAQLAEDMLRSRREWAWTDNITHASDAWAYYAQGTRMRKVYDNGKVVDLAPDEYLILPDMKEIEK